MIHYKYVHTGSQYVAKLNIKRGDDTSYDYNERIFETLRENIGGEALTYAILNNEFVMLRSTNAQGSLFLKGLKGNMAEISNYPIRYLEKFETSPMPNDKVVDVLANATLPSVMLRSEFSRGPEISNIFPQLLDILLYGDKNKQIIINTATYNEAMQYVKTISNLLPVSVIKQLGFCVGSTNIGNANMSIVNDMGERQNLNIRLWISNFSNFSYHAYSENCYVFDTVSSQNNYVNELSNAAKTLEITNINDNAKLNKLALCIQDAFDGNGIVNIDKLNKKTTIYSFNDRPSENSAKIILDLGDSNDPEQNSAVLRAIDYLINNAERSNRQIDADTMQKITNIYYTNPRQASQMSEELFKYCIRFYYLLSENERSLLLDLISIDETGKRLEDFLKPAKKSYGTMVETFEFAMRLIPNHNPMQENSNIIFTEKLIQFFAINDCYNLIPIEQRSNGENVFLSLDIFDEETKGAVCAILMASAYRSNMDARLCGIRNNGLKKLLKSLNLSASDQIKYIMNIRKYITVLARRIPELYIDSDFDFIFNCDDGRFWMQEIIDSLQISELLELYNMNDYDNYESLQQAIYTRLLDEKYIRSHFNVRSDIHQRAEYERFFKHLPRDAQEENRGIATFLHELGFESGINEKFALYRYNFAVDCFKTLHNSDKKKILKNIEILPSYESLDESKRLEIVEKTTRVFGTISKGGKKSKRFFSTIGIWSFFLALLSLIILVIPAIVMPASLGNLDVQHIIDKIFYYFRPEFLAVPCVVYLFNCIVYGFLKEGNRVKRANTITVICCIVPALLFVASYILFYFVHIPFPLLDYSALIGG